MSPKTKWIVSAAVAIAALLLVVIFSKNIWNWMENILVELVIYAVVFCAGWLLGRYGGQPRSRGAESIT